MRLDELPEPSLGTHLARKVAPRNCWSTRRGWSRRSGSSQSPPSSCPSSSCCCDQTRWRSVLWLQAGQRHRSRRFLEQIKFLYSKVIAIGCRELKAHPLARWGKLGWCTWWSPSWPRSARERSLSPCLTPRWLSSPEICFFSWWQRTKGMDTFLKIWHFSN